MLVTTKYKLIAQINPVIRIIRNFPMLRKQEEREKRVRGAWGNTWIEVIEAIPSQPHFRATSAKSPKED